MSRYFPAVDLGDLLGLIFSRIVRTDEAILFKTAGRSQKARYFSLHHVQDCCESVYVEDVCGDLHDLTGSPIVRSEGRFETGDQEYGSFTFSFYELATNKGSVTIRFYGSSNGYYSESADLYEIDRDAFLRGVGAGGCRA